VDAGALISWSPVTEPELLRVSRYIRVAGYESVHRLIGLGITLVILKITWDSWRTIRDEDVGGAPAGSAASPPRT
jgi:hypothetical protein